VGGADTRDTGEQDRTTCRSMTAAHFSQVCAPRVAGSTKNNLNEANQWPGWASAICCGFSFFGPIVQLHFCTRVAHRFYQSLGTVEDMD